jgi:hypothetical protein
MAALAMGRVAVSLSFDPFDLRAHTARHRKHVTIGI